MKIDVLTLKQGVDEARLNEEFLSRILGAIDEISYEGPGERPICDYDKLLRALAEIEPDDWLSLALLWKKLGHKLGSGISAAPN